MPCSGDRESVMHRVKIRLRPVALIVLAAACLSACPKPPVGDPPTAAILALERAAFGLVNQQRINAGLPALIMHDTLRIIARNHSRDMVARDFFAHVNPDGQDPFDRLRAGGIRYTLAGENLARTNAADPAATVVQGWMGSPDHRENILRPGFEHTGMGVAEGPGDRFYFTQLFVTFAKTGAEESVLVESCPEPLAVPAPQP